MKGDISPAPSQNSLSGDVHVSTQCAKCGRESICGELGVISYNVPIEDPRFGKLFRCPNLPKEADVERLERVRRLSNMDALAAKRFDNFQTQQELYTPDQKRSLQIALEKMVRFAQNPEDWVILAGSYGCGKTHLAAAAGNECLARGQLVLFVTVPDLLDYLRSTFAPTSEQTYDETFERVRNAPVLILDDLGAENTSAWAREKLYQLLNHRHTRRMPTVITTNIELDNMDERIRSRLLDRQLISYYHISAPDFRTSVKNSRHQLSSLDLYKHMTFEVFHDKKTNPLEKANLTKIKNAAINFAQNPDGWLVLFGDYHYNGKTHLAAAIANQYSYGHEQDVIFITVPDLLDYLRNSYGSQTSAEKVIQTVREIPLLILDDLKTASASVWAKEKLLQVLDYRYLTHKPTVITVSKDGEVLDDRIKTRLMNRDFCQNFSITARDYPTRMKG